MGEDKRAANMIPGYAEFLSKLSDALGEIPPPPIFASGQLFPTEHAWSFSRDRQDYVLGSPGFWKQLPAERSARPASLSDIAIIDVDDPRNSAVASKIYDAIAAHLDANRTPPQPGAKE